MKKFIASLSLIVALFSSSHTAYAAYPTTDKCTKQGVQFVGDTIPDIVDSNSSSINFTLSGLVPGETYTIYEREGIDREVGSATASGNNDAYPGRATFNIIDPEAFETGTRKFEIRGEGLGSNSRCNLWNYKVEEAETYCNLTWSQDGYSNNAQCINSTLPVKISASNITFKGELLTNTKVRIHLNRQNAGGEHKDVTTNSYGGTTVELPTDGNGAYEIKVYELSGNNELICSSGGSQSGNQEKFTLNASNSPDPDGNECSPIKSDSADVSICNSIPNPDTQADCRACMGGTSNSAENSGKVWTGLGCLDASPSGFIKNILSISIGLGGGIAFIMLIFGAFLLTTSAGDPKATDNAKQIITGALTGLFVIIFSVVILNIIGVQILQIPGL